MFATQAVERTRKTRTKLDDANDVEALRQRKGKRNKTQRGHVVDWNNLELAK